MNNRNRTILAVFAHPDDDALACLGTLAKFAHEQCQVYVLTLTAGDRSNTAIGKTRLTEAENVAGLVGYSLLKQELTDGYLKCDIEMISLVEKHIQELSPQIVITHYPQNFGYGHQDHDSVSSAVVNAARRASCVNITDYMDLKKQAIRLHKSEDSKAYMLPDIAATRAQWWALQNHPDSYGAGCYFEPFVLVKGLLGRGLFMGLE
jgi:LmbE family N-acetylglucosaminyl deacetylase